ncbi:MAG: hypothetical protein IPO80_09390 [Propionibacteriaceae bacterium]|nr:hypothetical protein [Propionibacteriaceae bacterium]
MTADGDFRRWRLPAAALVSLHVLLLAWLAAVAFSPGLATLAPAWAAWLATPTSAPAMALGLLLSAAAFAAVLASRGQDLSRVPFLLSAWCAASAAPLAMAAYLPCTGDAPPFWAAVTATLALLLGSFEAPFGAGEACPYAVPLGLQLARLLAIVATLSGATSVLFAVSRSQLDRWGILAARHLTVVIGLDETSWPALQQLAAHRDGGHRTLLLTSDLGTLAERARAAGVLVLRTGSDDPLGQREALPWNRVGRCYLLSPDASTNRARATALRSALRANGIGDAPRDAASATRSSTAPVPPPAPPLRRFETPVTPTTPAPPPADPLGSPVTPETPASPTPAAPLRPFEAPVTPPTAPTAPTAPTPARAERLTIIARIDDPWHADDWRKRHIGEPGFVLDAIGTYEATAEALVRRLRALPGVDEWVLTGEAPLLLALCAELSQRGRELQFSEEAAALPRVTLLDRDADDLAADHRVRQQRFAFDPVQVLAVTDTPSLESLQRRLNQVTAAGHRAAVVIARAGTRLGTRLAVRHPDLPILEMATGSRPLTGDDPSVGSLSSFNLAFTDAAGRSADAWERAAQAVHERYRRRFAGAELAVPWAELPREFYRESNRRQLHSILDAMAALGRSWAPTRPEAQPGPDPDGLAAAGPDDLIRTGLAFFGLSVEELSRVAEHEHESWRRHYLADGWRPGGVRDAHRRRHPDLLPWRELGAEARRKTMAGCVDTLFALRALGYRSVPAADWADYVRVGEVQAERLDGSLSWTSAGGDQLSGDPGDWVVSDASGGRRTVTDPSFRAGHRHLTGDRWLRTGVVQARRAVDGETVHSQEGATVAGRDSWVVRDEAGNEWVVPDDHLRTAYRPASQA